MALGQLPPDRRPHVVHVVDRIPTTTSHRPLPNAFAQKGRPKDLELAGLAAPSHFALEPFEDVFKEMPQSLERQRALMRAERG